MDTVEIPSYFLCPISLQIMKDPVTLSTGITYDRETIEKWLFSGKNNTCPATKQILTDTTKDLIPNVTLRRLIQAWCLVNASQEIERFPTPKPLITKSQLLKLINEAKISSSPQTQIKCLQKLKSICSRNETNKRALENGGVADFLASIVNISSRRNSTVGFGYDDDDMVDQITNRTSDEALSLLYSLQLSESGLKSLFQNNGEFVESLVRVMQRGSYDSRAYAALLLKSMVQVADEMQLVTLKPVFFFELVELLRDQISPKVSKATLKLLIKVCQYGRNRIKAAEAGAIPVLIELLLESTEKRETEMILIVIESLCHCAEGRSEFLKHGAGLAIVSKKILRVSQTASERGVRILHLISRFAATVGVVQDMLSFGVVAKLCFVLQVDCGGGSKMKERANEILKQNAWAWKNSNCIPISLIPSYPC